MIIKKWYLIVLHFLVYLLYFEFLFLCIFMSFAHFYFYRYWFIKALYIQRSLCHMFLKSICDLTFCSFYSTYKFLPLTWHNQSKFSFIASGYSFCLERLYPIQNYFLNSFDFHDSFVHIWIVWSILRAEVNLLFFSTLLFSSPSTLSHIIYLFCSELIRSPSFYTLNYEVYLGPFQDFVLFLLYWFLP